MIEGQKRVAAAVRDYIARRHMSREEFAFRTKLGKSTVDKFLIGLFSDRTLSIVEHHTQLALRPILDGPAVEDGAIEAEAETDAPAPASAPPRAPAQPRAESRPSIAVLPFANLSSDPAHDVFADGIAEDLTTALARLRWLFVISRSSSFAYRGRAVDVRDVARELGVRYVLAGSVRVAGSRLRVTGQLVDAESGNNIWAERFDREISDIFDMQDDITGRVVAAVEPHLYSVEGARAALVQPENIDAWGLGVRAIDLIHRFDRAHNDEACALLRRAVTLDPGYARAHALLGWAVWWAGHCDWLPDRREAQAEAAGHAAVALGLDANDPWARMVGGLAHSTAGRHDRAMVELSAALAVNPSFALGHSIFGWVLLRAGRFEEAIAETSEALRLSPIDGFSGLYSSVHGLALLAAQRFEEALPHLRRAVAALPGYGGHYNSLISCCGHLGLMEEARHFREAREALGPPLRASAVRASLADFAHGEVFVTGLEKAGVPE